jgi:hypothetical protein
VTYLAVLFVALIVALAFYLNKKLDARAERRRRARENITSDRR